MLTRIRVSAASHHAQAWLPHGSHRWATRRDATKRYFIWRHTAEHEKLLSQHVLFLSHSRWLRARFRFFAVHPAVLFPCVGKDAFCFPSRSIRSNVITLNYWITCAVRSTQATQILGRIHGRTERPMHNSTKCIEEKHISNVIMPRERVSSWGNYWHAMSSQKTPWLCVIIMACSGSKYITCGKCATNGATRDVPNKHQTYSENWKCIILACFFLLLLSSLSLSRYDVLIRFGGDENVAQICWPSTTTTKSYNVSLRVPASFANWKQRDECKTRAFQMECKHRSRNMWRVFQ